MPIFSNGSSSEGDNARGMTRREDLSMMSRTSIISQQLDRSPEGRRLKREVQLQIGEEYAYAEQTRTALRLGSALAGDVVRAQMQYAADVLPITKDSTIPAKVRQEAGRVADLVYEELLIELMTIFRTGLGAMEQSISEPLDANRPPSLLDLLR